MIGSVSSAALFQVQQPRAAAPPQATQTEQTEEQRTLNALQEAASGETESNNPNQLTEEEEKLVQELRQTDQEVRSHEQTHKTVGGPYAGAIQYETTTGPDGRENAVGGEVQIDVSPVPNNPEATIRKMDVVVRAALAPTQPSPQDYAVARAAQTARLQAQNELSQQREAERSGENAEQNPALSTEQQEQLSELIQTISDARNSLSSPRGSVFNGEA